MRRIATLALFKLEESLSWNGLNRAERSAVQEQIAEDLVRLQEILARL